MLAKLARDITSQDGLDIRDDLSLSYGAMDTGILIDGLAKDLGISEAARKKWRQRGVPHRWRLAILRKAAEQGVVLPDEAFGRRIAA